MNIMKKIKIIGKNLRITPKIMINSFRKKINFGYIFLNGKSLGLDI